MFNFLLYYVMLHVDAGGNCEALPPGPRPTSICSICFDLLGMFYDVYIFMLHADFLF
jgi:hypothetical protein